MKKSIKSLKSAFVVLQTIALFVLSKQTKIGIVSFVTFYFCSEEQKLYSSTCHVLQFKLPLAKT